jgi:choline kinase
VGGCIFIKFAIQFFTQFSGGKSIHYIDLDRSCVNIKKMKPTLMILAAGMASRYGSMKQTEGFGPNQETIMDYSIFDAIRAGFGKVVFIIRKDFADVFEKRFNEKLVGKIEVEYVYQELSTQVPVEMDISHRSKPWGTGHAVLCAMEKITEPFAVINADDFYGSNSFEQAAQFLINECHENKYAIIGYQLDKTLSDNGSVSRGVCETNEVQQLISIKERTKIYRNNSQIVYEENGVTHELNPNSSVSMNFWCFHTGIFNDAQALFTAFLNTQGNDPKSEFFIPILADAFIKKQGCSIAVIPTSSNWFGVTYKEDAPTVKARLFELIQIGVYPENLWG